MSILLLFIILALSFPLTVTVSNYVDTRKPFDLYSSLVVTFILIRILVYM